MGNVIENQPFSFWAIIGFYALILAGISIYFAKYVKNTDDFFSGSRHTAWWVSGLSFFMTAFSASIFVGQASFTYKHGGLSLIMVASGFIYFGVGYFLLSRRWHRTGMSTAIEFVDKRYSPATSKFFVWTGIPMRILDNANRLYVTAVLIEVLLGVGLFKALVFTAIITIVYTIAGGFLAVVLTDAIQAIVMAVIVVVVAVVSVLKIGGIGEIVERLPDSFYDLSPAGTDYGMFFIVAMAVVAIFSWNGYWSLVQRYVSVETEKDAQKVSLTSWLSYWILFPLFAVPPIIATILVPGLKGMETEHCYIKLANLILPAGLMGLLCFAILGATVTALNSEMNVMSQVMIKDVLKKRLKGVSQKTQLFVSRCLIVIIMILCMAVASVIRKLGGSFVYLMVFMSITILPTFMPLLFGLFNKRTPGWGAILAFCVGLTVGIVCKFGFQMHLAWMVTINFFATLATLWITGLLFPIKGDQKIFLDGLFVKLCTSGSGNPKQKTDASFIINTTSLTITGISFLLVAVAILLTAIGLDESNVKLTVVTAVIFFIIAAVVFIIRGISVLRFKDGRNSAKENNIETIERR
jgi:solute:Na+ symporter, SSS family